METVADDNNVAQKIDELSLLLVMLDLDDSVGLSAALDICKSVALEAKTHTYLERLSSAFNFVIEISKTEPAQTIYNTLKETVSTAQAFFQNTDGLVFPNEKNNRIELQHVENDESEIALESEEDAIKIGEPYVISADAELLSEFMAEANDHLSAVEVVLLEKDSDFTLEDTDTIFRGVHSLKGTSSYFNLLEINESSHLLENILDEVRSGKRNLGQELKELVLRYVDLQKNLMESARKAVADGGLMKRKPEVAIFIRDIERFFNGESSLAKEPVVIQTQELKVEQEKREETLILTPVSEQQNLKVEQEVSPKSLNANFIQKDAPAKDAPAKDAPAKDAPAKDKEVSSKNANKDISAAKTFVKIDTERLDSLGEMIGEMVIYSSMLVRKCRESMSTDESIMRMSDQVEKFSRELQDIGMSMRLDPIKGLFQKMSRLVWDTSRKLGKEINLQLKGEDTELDRNVIERLADPLMHMVRNSLDHGIETPDERLAKGKSREGNVILSASHEGGNIVIKISDDGRGLDPQKLYAKAVQKGILRGDERLSEQEVHELIFAPGFSTAEQVTDISGRGVGMDVVRTNIEGMRGRVRIQSELGSGSVFTIELPLTLAIIEGIEAAVGEEKFIVPTLSVVELMRPTSDMLSTTLHSGETFFFRGKHIPLFRLSDIFLIDKSYIDPADGIVVVVENSGEQVGLLVDQISGSCQTVIKSLGPMFERQTGVAGCAIMPNGDIGLILDVRSLISKAREEVKKDQKVKNYVMQNAEGVALH